MNKILGLRYRYQFFSKLAQMYPENRTDLIWFTPFQLLVSVILSAQTTDKQVNKVMVPLYESGFSHPSDIIKWGLDDLTQKISTIGLYKSKAKNLYRMAQQLIDYSSQWHDDPMMKQYGYRIPDNQSDLQKLSGVGEKTAKVILHVLFGHPVIAVDTHVHRVCNRIGLVKTDTPLQTSRLIADRIPKKYRSIAHHSLIFFGRYHCKAINPLCDTCPFCSFCFYYKEIKKNIRK